MKSWFSLQEEENRIMKKAAVISAIVLAAALSFQGTWAREPVAGEAAPVSEAAYTYDN